MYARSTKLKYVALLILPLTWVEVAAQSAVLPVGVPWLDPQGPLPQRAIRLIRPNYQELSLTIWRGDCRGHRAGSNHERHCARTTRSDTNGSFVVSGLAAGNYRLVVSNTGLKQRNPCQHWFTGTRPAARSLVVGAVSTTINVQGREDDLIGVAESGTQGTWAKRKSKIARFFAREKSWRRFLVSSSRNTPAAAGQPILSSRLHLDTAQISPSSSTICRFKPAVARARPRLLGI